MRVILQGSSLLRLSLIVALSIVLFAPHAQAATLSSVSSDCGTSSNGLTAVDSATPLGVSVEGPLSISQIGSGHCVTTWEASTTIHLAAGTYVIGHVINFQYLLTGGSASSDGEAALVWDFLETLAGNTPSIESTNTFFAPSSGVENETIDTSIFPVTYDLLEGDYVIQHKATLPLTVGGGGG